MSKMNSEIKSISGLSGSLFGGGGGGGGRRKSKTKIAPIRDTPSQIAERAAKEQNLIREKNAAAALAKADLKQQERGYPAGHIPTVPDAVITKPATWDVTFGAIGRIPFAYPVRNPATQQIVDDCKGCHVAD